MKPNIFVARGDLKNATLSAISRGLNGSREIFNSIDYASYQNFHKNLYNLVRRGYIHKAGKKPHSRYTLTKKGKFHFENPNYYQERKAMIFSKKLESIMKDSEQYQQILIRMAAEDIQNKNRNGLPSTPFVLPSNIKEGVDFGNDEIEDNEDNGKVDYNDNIKIVENLQKQVRLLKYQNKEIVEEKEMIHQNYEQLIEQGKIKKKVNPNNQNTNIRRALADECMNRFNGVIDEYFADKWGFVVVLMDGGSIMNKNYVEIVSKSHTGFSNGQIIKKLTNKEILKKKICIIKYDKLGIMINAKCLQKPKYLKFDRFSKGPQQTKPQMTQRPPQRRVIIKPSKRT